VSLLWLLCKKLGGEDNIILRFQLWIDCRKELLAALEMFAPVKEEFKLLCAQVDQLETENEKKMTQGYSSDISSELYLQTGKFTPLAKPVKEAKISAKVLQRALAISRTIGKDKIDPDGAGN
jgi:VIT1/CCC1 family predicted Fe2+/Mn2+ transporter